MLFHLVFGSTTRNVYQLTYLPSYTRYLARVYASQNCCITQPAKGFNTGLIWARIRRGKSVNLVEKKNPPGNSYSVVPIVKGGLGVDSHSKVSWHENEERNMNTCKAFFVRSTVDISCVIRVHASTEALNFTIGQGAANTKAVDSARC